MAEPHWTIEDMAIVNTKLNGYLIQNLMAQGVLSRDNVQEMVDEFLNKTKANPKAEGAYEYAKVVLGDIPGINV